MLKDRGKGRNVKEYLRLSLVALIALFLVFLFGRFSYTFISYMQRDSKNKVNIVELWNSGEYNRVLGLSEVALFRNPLDATALFFAGIASYSVAIYSSESEERYSYIENSIFHLRRHLSVAKSKNYEGEALYVLAKAYHHKGTSYANLVIKYLDKARSSGYAVRAMNEYYGLAYIQLGNYSEGINYFLQAEDEQRNANFYFNLAEAYSAAGRVPDSERFYRRVIEDARGDALADKARYQLAMLYLKQARYLDGQLLLLSLLERYPDNADAHFNLGESYYFLGDRVRARQAWQRAARLDYSNSDVIARLHS